MAAVCQVTGAVPGFGHSISHSHRRKVTLNVSAKGIKVIDARGIDAVVAEIIARGEKI